MPSAKSNFPYKPFKLEPSQKQRSYHQPPWYDNAQWCKTRPSLSLSMVEKNIPLWTLNESPAVPIKMNILFYFMLITNMPTSSNNKLVAYYMYIIKIIGFTCDIVPSNNQLIVFVFIANAKWRKLCKELRPITFS